MKAAASLASCSIFGTCSGGALALSMNCALVSTRAALSVTKSWPKSERCAFSSSRYARAAIRSAVSLPS
eukprot:12923679-Prorocentrum_lima.AAC.1